MNKRTVIFVSGMLFSCAAGAGSTIDLPLPTNNIIPAHSELALSVDTLTAEVPYMVTCTLDAASAPRTDINIAPALAHDGGFGVVALDGKAVLKNTGTLHQGQNTLTLMVSIPAKKENLKNAILLKNLDNRFSLSVKKCSARPVTHVSARQNIETGGYFYVTNHLPYYVDITVGTYFPTPYCIYPYTRQYVSTSSAYQDIDIVGTHY